VRCARRPRRPGWGGGAARRAEALAGYIFLLPAGLLLAIFLVWPTLQVLGLSVTDYQLLAPSATHVVGLDNYRQLLHDADFRDAVRVTLTFALGALPLQATLALVLALVLNLRLPGGGMLRAAFFYPTILSVVVAGVIWSYLYHPTQGLFNQLLTGLGLPRQPFLSGRDQALPAIGALAAWQNVGFYMVIFLAGLRQIPPQCYEAAALDGATGWQQLRFITLPLLRPISAFVAVVGTIYALRLFTEVYVLTRGGPFGATRTLIYFIWEEGLRFRHTAYAAAAAVLFFLLVLAITLVQRRLLEAGAGR